MTSHKPKLWTGLTAVALLSATTLTGCAYDDWNHRDGWGRHGERGEGGERGERGERGGWEDRGERGERGRRGRRDR